MKISSAVKVLALLAIGTTAAQASSVPFAGNYTFIGTLNVTPPPGSVNVEYNNSVTSLGAFNNGYFFYLQSAAGVTGTGSLNGDSGDVVTGYKGELFAFTPDVACVAPADGAVCNGATNGAAIATANDFNPLAFQGSLGFGPTGILGAGWYAWIVSGNYTTAGSTLAVSHSGQLDVTPPRVPEPGSLALLGLGLVGLGLSRRRAK